MSYFSILIHSGRTFSKDSQQSSQSDLSFNGGSPKISNASKSSTVIIREYQFKYFKLNPRVVQNVSNCLALKSKHIAYVLGANVFKYKKFKLKFICFHLWTYSTWSE